MEEGSMLLGALEAGGTKMVLAIGNEAGDILEQTTISTADPAETIPEIISFFKARAIQALGVGSFGPVDLNRNSPTYGFITSTPKLAWAGYNLLGVLKDALGVPVGFDTDVNAAVLAEATWGSLRGLSSGVYITVGTGIGTGIYLNGQLLHGMLHPEAGHILLSRHPEDAFEGVCPYHPNCMEGLASGPSLEKRYHKNAGELEKASPAWEIEAYYLAQGIVNYILTLSPHRIILGGGVMKQLQLFPLIRAQVRTLLNGYIRTPQLEDLDTYIVPSSLEGKQGIMGCLRLAALELTQGN